MAIPDDDRKRNEANYETSSKSLQTLVVVFFAFILFFTYVLVPYYFMGDKYQSEKNIVYFLPMIRNNFSFIEDTFRNFSSGNSHYLQNLNSTNNDSVDYLMKINSAKQLFDLFNKNITVPKANLALIVDNATSAKTYPICYLTNSKFNEWVLCNSARHTTDFKKEKYVLLDTKTTKTVDGKIHNVEKLLDSVTLYNGKADILNASDLDKWNHIVVNWKQFANRPSSSQNISYLSFDNYLNPNYYAEPSKSPKERQNLTADIEKEIKSYASKLDSLEYPIVGKVPVLNINGAFISFPFLIAIGFSFLSLQFKKIIKIHKDLNLDNKDENDRIFMSWIDPLQPYPEKIFPLLIIIVPSILFVIFLFFIHSLWYENDPYLHGSIAGDLLWIPDYIKVIFYISVILGGAIFGFSYREIIKAWRKPNESNSHQSSYQNKLFPNRK